MEKEIYQLHADICKTLANPKRLEIINCLRYNEMNVNDITKEIGARKSNISQHLTIMKLKGILSSRRDGIHIYYKVSSPKVIKAFDIMREVLLEHLSKNEKIITKLIKSKI